MPEGPLGTSPLTHFDAEGQAHMVDVGGKAHTARIARAAGSISMLPETFALVRRIKVSSCGSWSQWVEPRATLSRS